MPPSPRRPSDASRLVDSALADLSSCRARCKQGNLDGRVRQRHEPVEDTVSGHRAARWSRSTAANRPLGLNLASGLVPRSTAAAAPRRGPSAGAGWGNRGAYRAQRPWQGRRRSGVARASLGFIHGPCHSAAKRDHSVVASARRRDMSFKDHVELLRDLCRERCDAYILSVDARSPEPVCSGDSGSRPGRDGWHAEMVTARAGDHRRGPRRCRTRRRGPVAGWPSRRRGHRSGHLLSPGGVRVVERAASPRLTGCVRIAPRCPCLTRYPARQSSGPPAGHWAVPRGGCGPINGRSISLTARNWPCYGSGVRMSARPRWCC
jgi:hypothetical protein